jgi:hypothetical protein
MSLLDMQRLLAVKALHLIWNAQSYADSFHTQILWSEEEYKLRMQRGLEIYSHRNYERSNPCNNLLQQSSTSDKVSSVRKSHNLRSTAQMS